MERSGSRWLGAAHHGPRHAAALAVVAVAVAGCQAAVGVAGRSSAASPASPHSAASPAAGRSAASAAARTRRSAPSSVGSPRIMIVGDSITEGSSGDYTWQYWLYEHLRADGIRPRMVGPHHWLFNNVTKVDGDSNYANPNFQHANDTSWGMALF